MGAVKKITVHISEELLEKAQAFTKEGITDTIRLGLKLVAASQAYEDLRTHKGRVKFSLNLKKLREDRE